MICRNLDDGFNLQFVKCHKICFFFKFRKRKSPELMGSLKLGNVWAFVQLIFGPRWPMNQLIKNPNIEASYQLCGSPTSSIANRRPPTGAPNAEAIPAAAPALMKFLRSFEFRKRSKMGRLKPRVLDCEEGRSSSIFGIRLFFLGPNKRALQLLCVTVSGRACTRFYFGLLSHHHLHLAFGISKKLNN